MLTLTNPNIQLATIQDAKQLETLLNTAYRGETAKLGWTHEADLIAGDVRANEAMIMENFNANDSVFLKYLNSKNEIIGCVNLKKVEEKLYLGMFSVHPIQQGNGIGNHLLLAAEEYATHVGSNTIYMTVISLRNELINWYKTKGYKETGERQPFVEDAVTGTHLQQLEFMVLEKIILLQVP
jgi:N-acetylglutamate synthase-like GNAT family acetyltransferase